MALSSKYYMNWYSLEVVSGPSSEPVTAEELHAHLYLNVDLSAVQDLLLNFITTARMMFEHETGIAVGTQTLRQHQAGWYVGGDQRHWRHWRHTVGTPVKLVRAPAASVVNVKYYDSTDTLITMDPAAWSSDLTGTPGIVYFPGEWVYPALSLQRPRPVQVEFTCGWATDAVPIPVKVAIMEQAGHLYNYRESHTTDTVNEVPLNFKYICDMYRTGVEVF